MGLSDTEIRLCLAAKRQWARLFSMEHTRLEENDVET